MPLDANEGHNGVGAEVEGLTPDRFHHHTAAITRQKAKCEAERAVLNKLRKAAKADGIILKELDAMMIVADMTPREQREHIERSKWYLEMLAAPVGSQMTLGFDRKPDNDDGSPAEQEILDTAYGQGFRAGLAEKDEFENPHQPNNSIGMKWLEGHRDGLTKLNKELAEQATRDEAVDLDDDLDSDLDEDGSEASVH